VIPPTAGGKNPFDRPVVNLDTPTLPANALDLSREAKIAAINAKAAAARYSDDNSVLSEATLQSLASILGLSKLLCLLSLLILWVHPRLTRWMCLPLSRLLPLGV
jgi:hypothetical protein